MANGNAGCCTFESFEIRHWSYCDRMQSFKFNGTAERTMLNDLDTDEKEKLARLTLITPLPVLRSVRAKAKRR